MEKIQGKTIKSNPQEHAQITLKVADLVSTVNQIMNPEGPVFDWFAGYEDAKAAIEVRDGKAAIVNPDILMGGEIDGQNIRNVKVVGYKGKDGGIYCDGTDTHAVVENAYITLEGVGKGLGGPDTGVSARNGATVEVHNAVINGYGKSRFCTTAESGSKLYVYNSVLWSHGQPWGEEYEAITEPMATPPVGLMIEGNSRTHCTMTNASSYFYNSKIICDGWGALSTEGAEGFLYLEANDCDIVVTKRGYGTYADPDCHVYFNRCHFDVADMTVLLAGKSDAHFDDCDCENGSFFALIHNVNGTPEEVGEMEVKNSRLHSGKELLLCRSENTDLHFLRTEMSSDIGVILRSQINDDPARTIPSDYPFGIRAEFEECKLEGDFIHEDPEREMFLKFKKVHLTGAIHNAALCMDVRSCWFATADSEVIFTGEIFLNQIDAPEGVVIRAEGAKAGEYILHGGGKLIVTSL